jgi:hypothetical protein
MVEDEKGLTSELPWCSIFFDSHFAFSFGRIRGALVALGGENYWATGQHHSLSGLQQTLLTSTTRLPAHTRASDIPGNTAMDKLSFRI